MKILLVYPQYPDTFWSFKHALKFISKKAALEEGDEETAIKLFECLIRNN